MGAVDVVPFVPIGGIDRPASRAGSGDLSAAVEARDRFVTWAARELELPCFVYGPERSLPELRRLAFQTLEPAAGPTSPHPTAGATAVGARTPLVAYNLWLAEPDLALARELAAELRSPAVRALGLEVGGQAQVSCNLVDPVGVGPAAVYDAVARRVGVDRAELVGLVPGVVLAGVPARRWSELDLDRERTIEARLEAAGIR
jgi:glutamate formiminotransferase